MLVDIVHDLRIGESCCCVVVVVVIFDAIELGRSERDLKEEAVLIIPTSDRMQLVLLIRSEFEITQCITRWIVCQPAGILVGGPLRILERVKFAAVRLVLLIFQIRFDRETERESFAVDVIGIVHGSSDVILLRTDWDGYLSICYLGASSYVVRYEGTLVREMRAFHALSEVDAGSFAANDPGAGLDHSSLSAW